MSTFEKVKRRILRDMDSCTTHDAMSWAQIMLQNTAQLTSEADQKKFWAKNPKYINGKSCVYVGQSSRKPSLRFAQHKEGYKSNKYAKVYGLKLRPDLYEQYNPIPTRKDAEAIEEMLGIGLRNRGYGVWFN